ncbi:Uncharacterised protein [Yersinia pekkanenii]|uniref:Uncharacterized protein n=1 Tax=Yersinia pekkanenii TaxID=1288385 RepID=A0A0T9QXU3_9GAMM|nr:Uncharacterised protein [Yersinia pekkanenii]CRY68283.1 Uncharacterised protein [Yersinia pekkanenii]
MATKQGRLSGSVHCGHIAQKIANSDSSPCRPRGTLLKQKSETVNNIVTLMQFIYCLLLTNTLIISK